MTRIIQLFADATLSLISVYPCNLCHLYSNFDLNRMFLIHLTSFGFYYFRAFSKNNINLITRS
jgi:hypothetical protein